MRVTERLVNNFDSGEITLKTYNTSHTKGSIRNKDNSNNARKRILGAILIPESLDFWEQNSQKS